MDQIIIPEYRPSGTEVIVRYEIIPLGKGAFHEILRELVRELFIGSEEGPETRRNFLPKVFNIQQTEHQCSIAFPGELFEEGNIAQHLSIITGSIFNSNCLVKGKVIDISWPSNLLSHWNGPQFKISEIRTQLEIPKGPISSVLLMPKIGLSTKECIEKAYHIWSGGCDIVEESPLICSKDSADFEERIQFLSKEEANCSKRTGKKKTYIPNITAGTLLEMEHRATKVKHAGLQAVTINNLFIGFSALNSLVKTCQELNLILIGNQYGEELFSKNSTFEISSSALSMISRILGTDALHIKETEERESEKTHRSLTKAIDTNFLINPCFPICEVSSSLSAVETFIKLLGNDLIIQAAEPVYSHPDGIKAGASALQHALEAAAQGIDQRSASEKHEALKVALERDAIISSH